MNHEYIMDRLHALTGVQGGGANSAFADEIMQEIKRHDSRTENALCEVMKLEAKLEEHKATMREANEILAKLGGAYIL